MSATLIKGMWCRTWLRQIGVVYGFLDSLLNRGGFGLPSNASLERTRAR
jgi:hypothetical protein